MTGRFVSCECDGYSFVLASVLFVTNMHNPSKAGCWPASGFQEPTISGSCSSSNGSRDHAHRSHVERHA
jgi:hypothetical protein